MRGWKAHLGSQGLPLATARGTRYLTNIRFADDLLVFGQSLEEARASLQALVTDLAEAGLCMNASKTKILTTDLAASSSPTPLSSELAGSPMEVLRGTASHKYLGRRFPGNLRSRGQCNLDFRVSCAWLRYHSLQHSWTNRRVPLKLQLKLFDSVVSPTALYSLPTTPLTSGQLAKLDATQRKMLRKIVGWRRVEDEAWETTGRHMKERLQRALQEQPVKQWSVARDEQRNKMLCKATSLESNSLLSDVYHWSLAPSGGKRARGHPFQRWWE